MKESKKLRNWFKTNFNLNTVLLVVLIIIFAIDVMTRSVLLDRSRLELEKMRAQVAYLQDTMNIVQSDVSNLETNLEATLEQENSLLESWSIEPVSANFAENSYDLRISLTPKNYTDATKASIFFGNREYPLTLNGHAYEGTVILSLEQNYDGNVTVLFSDDHKKATEVLSSYVGLQTQVRNVLSGSLRKAPIYRNGVLKADSSVFYELNVNTCFLFDNLVYVIQVGEDDVYGYDLIADEEVALVEDEEGKGFLNLGHDKSYHLASERGDLSTGTFISEVDADQRVRILLRATTDNGFAFEYEMFQGYTDFDGEGFAETFSLFESHYRLVDPLGGRWLIF